MQIICIAVRERAGFCDARVVDQHIDRKITLTNGNLQFIRRPANRKIHGNLGGSHAVAFANGFAEFAQCVQSARHQNHIVTIASELEGQRTANTSRCAGNENCPRLIRAH